MLYLRARYANLNTATFLTRDPFAGVMQRVLSRNGYTYVEGNPVNFADPSGKFGFGFETLAALVCPECVVAAIVIGGAVLLTIAVVSYILLANVPDAAGLQRAIQDVKNLCFGTTAASLIVQALSHSTAPNVSAPSSAVQAASASAGAISVPITITANPGKNWNSKDFKQLIFATLASILATLNKPVVLFRGTSMVRLDKAFPRYEDKLWVTPNLIKALQYAQIHGKRDHDTSVILAYAIPYPNIS